MFNAWAIFTAIRKAEGAAKLSIDPIQEQGIHEIALHLTTRDNIVRWCVRHLNRQLESIHEIALHLDPEETIVELKDELVYSLLLYLNSFVFESRAYVDHLCEFFINVHVKVLKNLDRNDAQKQWKALLRASELESREASFRFLDNTRDEMIHRSCIWPAIDLSRIAEGHLRRDSYDKEPA
jgi:hypothetical protein